MRNNLLGAVLKAMPMDSDNTLYHMMSLFRLRLAIDPADATLPCLGTVF